MELEYKCLGRIAFLVRYAPVQITGDKLKIKCNGPKKIELYSDADKKLYVYELKEGATEIPVSIIRNGVHVEFKFSENVIGATGTPLEIRRIGSVDYIMGKALDDKEERERMRDALIYAGSVGETALAVANETLLLRADVDRLLKRANSGDIINF